jgi:hypothetical protein
MAINGQSVILTVEARCGDEALALMIYAKLPNPPALASFFLLFFTIFCNIQHSCGASEGKRQT